MSDDASDPDGETEVAAAEDPEESTSVNRGLSDRAAFWTSLVLSLLVAVGSVWLIGFRAIHFEALNRVRPTVEGDGVGSGWFQGNTEPALELLITLVHFADVIMGVFIIVMVFIHWIAFRRLAARMRPPDAPRRADAVATDGGEREHGDRDPRRAVERERPDGGERAVDSRSSSELDSDGGEREHDSDAGSASGGDAE